MNTKTSRNYVVVTKFISLRIITAKLFLGVEVRKFG
jgi:hypothetical protein